MITARLSSPGTIGRVSVTSAVRTTIADPKFQPKPNVALTELTDVSITLPEDGEIVAYDASLGKYKTSSIADIAIGNINGGQF
jgi:hypothetical protein